MASTCSGHWSMSVTSWPALVSMPPTMDPIAPAPMMPIRVAMWFLLAGSLSLSALAIESRPRFRYN